MIPTPAADGTKDGFALAREVSARGPVALVVSGRPRDLAFVPPSGAEVVVVTQEDDLGREIVRHSAAHVLAQAVLRLFPEAKYTIGPPIEDGFYYDFDVARPFTPEDLERIETEMRAIMAENQRFERAEATSDAALELFGQQPYKRAIIEGVAAEADALEGHPGNGVLSIYRNVRSDGTVAFTDLCRGPHVPSTGRIKALRLLRTAGAYWRGDEGQPMLQRIYGTAWESKAALDSYLQRREEAERRDHRRLGRDLDLYSWVEEVGAGLPLWHPRGAVVRKELEDLSRAMHLERGYEPVFSPHIGKAALWETSGHLDFYGENMYPPMAADEADYYPKPMNCPFHILIFKSKTRSYRELPLRYSELGTVYRHERSGTLHGLLRSRGLTQDDSHIFCRPDQTVDEMVAVIDFLRDLYATVGLGPDKVLFSTRPEKSVGSDDDWQRAEAAIPEALAKAGVDYTIDEGAGNFYGPKIDIDVRDAIGRSWQLGTIQLDFQLPDRFDLTYTDGEGERVRPVMIHRALFGSIERFVAVLVEHFAGAFPTWLSPVQAVLIPIADRHHAYARLVAERLRARSVRVEIDDSSDTMRAKIRRHQLLKAPYLLVVGDDEIAADSVSVRRRFSRDSRALPADEFASALAAEIDERAVEPRV